MSHLLNKYKYILLFGFGFLTHVFLMNNFNIVHDEFFSLKLLSYSWSDMMHIIMTEDGHPPLFYILLRLWMFGTDYHNILLARLFSLTWILLLAALGPTAVKRLAGEKVGFLYTFIIFFAPASFFLSPYIRMYSMGVFFALASMLYSLLVFNENKKSDWVKFFIFSILGMYSHYLITLSISITYAILFFRLILKYKKWNPIFIRFFTCAFLTAILFFPWFLIFLNQANHMYNDWYPTTTSTLNSLALLLYQSHHLVKYNTVLDVPLVSFLNAPQFFLIILFLIACFTPQSKCKKDFLYIFLNVILLYLIAFGISFILRPILARLYIVFLLPPLYLIVAYMLGQEKKYLIAFLLFFIPAALLTYQRQYQTMFAPTYQVIQYDIRQNIPPDSTIICTTIEPCYILSFYLPEYKFLYVPLKKQLVALTDVFYKNHEKYKKELMNHPIFTLYLSSESCQNSYYDLHYMDGNYCLQKMTPRGAQILLDNSF